ncbi:MAG TPA: SRPBCC family protein [Candidatus Binatia bacterium]|jgi:uncharacterized membrane protein
MTDKPSTITEFIDVNVPVRTAYNQWTQFEEFPKFMQGVEEVEQIDDETLHWRAEMGGKTKEWDARITEQIPDKRIAWTSTSGAPNGGCVTFHRLSDGECRVTLQMDYDPEGIVENVGDTIGVVQWNVQENLKRFKEFIEQQGEETGGFRGSVRSPDEESASRRGSHRH